MMQNLREVFTAKKNGVLYFSSNFTMYTKKTLGANLISVHNIMQTLEFLTDFAYTEYIS